MHTFCKNILARISIFYIVYNLYIFHIQIYIHTHNVFLNVVLMFTF